MERLQKVIAQAGIASRRKAEELIQQERVKVNGQIVTEQGLKVSESDRVEVDGKKLNKAQRKEYYLMFKPKGVISSVTDDRGRDTVIDLIDSDARLYPVGRLDYDTSGIILITNDGDFANKLMHPSSQVKKTYVAMVEGLIDGAAVHALESGIDLEGKKTAKAKAKILDKDTKHGNSRVRLTITEGMYHQVKRMFEAVGYPVKSLHREGYGMLNLNGLEPGLYRKLKAEEVKDLLTLSKGQFIDR